MIDSACPSLGDSQVVMYEHLAEIEKRFEDVEVRLCMWTLSWHLLPNIQSVGELMIVLWFNSASELYSHPAHLC